MFEIFTKAFPRDAVGRAEGGMTMDIPAIPGLREFFAAFGGASFRDGLYRVLHPADLPVWTDRVCAAFPEFAGYIVCFGYDWLGRAFALDARRPEQGQSNVVMFEPGTGEALEIPANLQSFHDAELIEFGDAALAMNFHGLWLAQGAAPKYDQCVGYKKPLFLGGADQLQNLELSDLDVYWHLMAQMILKARALPARTPINVTKA